MKVTKILKQAFGAALLVAAAFVLVKSANPARTAQTALLPRTTVGVSRTIDRFGIDYTNLVIEDHRIGRNQTFYTILSEAGLSREVSEQVVDQSREVVDVRSLQVGQEYRLYRDQDEPRYMVLRKDEIDYVVFDLMKDVRVYEKSLPVEYQQRVIGGPISGSITAAIEEQGADPELADRLTEVFQWQVDFFHMKKGDSFRLVYEQKLVDGAPIGIGKVISARVSQEGKDYFAFYFKHDKGEGYYDEEGNSLQQRFLKMPVPYGRITSKFTKRRYHPVLHRYKAHLGTDFAAPHGTEIYAVGDGEVLEAKYQRGNGNYVKVSHGTSYATGYLHMSRIARGIRPGVKVKQGQVIGYVGSTGYASGPHVCFRFWRDGVQVDPQKAKMPAAEPLPEKYRQSFAVLRDKYLPMLNERGVRRPTFASLPDVSDLFGEPM